MQSKNSNAFQLFLSGEINEFELMNIAGVGVVYVMENRDTNKLYIGKHWCRPGTTYSFDEHMFSDGYRGSGADWSEDRDSMDTPQQDIRLLCILEECLTPDQLSLAEERWISYYSATTSPHFYNKTPIGGGGDLISKLPKDRYDKFIRDLKKRAVEHNFASHFGDVSGKNNGMYGKHHTAVTIQINRDKHTGKKQSEETKKKRSRTAIERGIVPPNNSGARRYTNGVYNIILKSETAVPEGFYTGLTPRAPKLCAKCLCEIGHIKYRLCRNCRS